MVYMTMPPPVGNSPAMKRINARAAAINAEVEAATGALGKVRADIIEASGVLGRCKFEISDAAMQLDSLRRQITAAHEKLKIPAIAAVNRAEVFKVIKLDACKQFGIKMVDLLSERRDRHLVLCRFYAAQRMVDETSASLPIIGRALGGRDHTTIMHAVRPENRQRVVAYIANGCT